VKIGAKVVAHGRYLVFQVAEVAVPRELFGRILDRIDRLRAGCRTMLTRQGLLPSQSQGRRASAAWSDDRCPGGGAAAARGVSGLPT
jgi:hypothetical protein